MLARLLALLLAGPVLAQSDSPSASNTEVTTPVTTGPIASFVSEVLTEPTLAPSPSLTATPANGSAGSASDINEGGSDGDGGASGEVDITRTDITTPVTAGPIATFVSSVLAGAPTSVPSGALRLQTVSVSASAATSASATRASSATASDSPAPASEPIASLNGSVSPSSSIASSAAASPTFSYPQPPLPKVTVRTPPQAFALNSLTQRPRERRYTLRLSYAAGSPDGFLRRMSVINGQFPGPLIQATVGDTLTITVINDLDTPQSVHWHGIRQEGTGYYDGPPGITQCPIAPGGRFTYRFKCTSYGTYWYHSHYGNTLADGLYGALIVYSPDDPIKRWRDFDAEKVLFVSDWYDDQSDTIVAGLHNLSSGYRGQPFATMPDSVLINGVGQTDCTKAQVGVKCTRTRPATVHARLGSRLKLRLVNPGSESLIRVSVDQHVLQLVEVDDTPVRPVYMHEVSLAVGQRVSVILHLNQGGVRDAFWIRARAAAGCIFRGFEMETRAVLRYTDRFGLTWSRRPPTSAPWPDRAATLAPCLDSDQEHTLVPVEKEPLGPVSARGRLDSMAGRFVDPVTGADFLGFGIGANGGQRVTYTNYINDPVLKQVMDGRPLNSSHFAHLSLNGSRNQTADILLNQLDRALTHPFHLHGRPFTILARGEGSTTLEELGKVEMNPPNPLRRDTILMPNGTWALLRVPLDDPGVWPIHCHLGWHLANGKLGVVVVRPEVVRGFEQPKEWLGLCTGDPDEIGPAKRAIYDDAEPESVPGKNATATKPGSSSNHTGVKNATVPVPPSIPSNTSVSASDPDAESDTEVDHTPVFAVFETPSDKSYANSAAAAYDHIPADAAEAWSAPGLVGNVSVGGGATPLDSARRQGLLNNGSGVPDTADMGSTSTTSPSANSTVAAPLNLSASALPSSSNSKGGKEKGTDKSKGDGHVEPANGKGPKDKDDSHGHGDAKPAKGDREHGQKGTKVTEVTEE